MNAYVLNAGMYRTGERRRTLPYRPRTYAVPIGSFWDDVADVVTAPVTAAEAVVGAGVSATEDVVSWTAKAVANLATDPLGTIESAASDVVDVAGSVIHWVEGAAESVVAEARVALKVFTTIAPFIQMGLSFIPGIGTVASAAIGAAVALASGRPITDALIAAAKGACPGGPVVADAFESAVSFAAKVASGENVLDAVGQAALEDARQTAVDELGTAGGIAFDTGLALAHGKSIQDAAVSAGLSVASQYVPNVPEAQAAFSMASDALKGNPQNPASIAALASGVAPPEAIQAAQSAGVVIDDATNVYNRARAAYTLVFPPEGADAVKVRTLVLQKLRERSAAGGGVKQQIAEASRAISEEQSVLPGIFISVGRALSANHPKQEATMALPAGVFQSASRGLAAVQQKRAIYSNAMTLSTTDQLRPLPNAAHVTAPARMTLAAQAVNAEKPAVSPALAIGAGVAGVGVLALLGWALL